MDLTPYVTAVEDSLAAAASAGSEETHRTAAALTAALEPATRLAIMDALSDLAREVSDALGDRTVELRLESGQVHAVVSPSSAADDQAFESVAGPDDSVGEPARVTLRLPESLKSGAERAAAAGGVSLNTWLIRAVQENLRAAGRLPESDRAEGHRLRGFVQA
jgi:hypothetical protein